MIGARRVREVTGKQHDYAVEVRWTGNRGVGTRDYRSYSRDHEIVAGSKPVLVGSSDPAFRGDPGRYNPEELLVASLASCHMLWYLHLCSAEAIVVSDYRDAASGRMLEAEDGGGEFDEVVLRPQVRIERAASIERARQLHASAHELCFIARSVKFDVRCEPVVVAESPAGG